ncbi:hypothetical protein CORT_0A05440 [Candida orthopsilosis Co 90-125]|uniref:Uncharacterized protein n=1 Tax=Candida orthopsilosis (strain 90-125) TaxID=1136231 RepID=H8WXY4_CANO9|nr:hypothetical protein CORT_0A05440 [Candida orthopsilosis Co 90-125]CCG20931.1 hypothetical protein CORT_0A05440 [Candida orthopsilosis Co 90-125]
MNTRSFNIIFIVLHALIVGVLVVAYTTQTIVQDGQASDDPAKDVGCVVLGATIALLAYMTKFVYYLLILPQAHHRLILFQIGHSSYESFYQPMLEEVIKFAAIMWFQHAKCDGTLNLFELSLIWCGFTIPSLTIYFYNPQRYSQKYERFLMYHQSWLIQMRGGISSTAEENYRLSKVWSNLVSENIDSEIHDKERRRSTISSDRSHTSSHRLKTKISSKISSKMLPSEFNLGQDATQTVPIIASSPNIDISPPIKEEYATTDESYSKAIQKLYSVSPKGTYHLIRAVAIATFDEDDEEEGQLEREDATICTERMNGKATSRVLLPDVEEVFENIDDSFDERQSLSDDNHPMYDEVASHPSPRNLFSQDIESYNTNGEASAFETSETTPEVNSDRSIRSFNMRVLAFINWWSWLCPPLLPICEPSQYRDSASLYIAPSASNPQFANERFPLLKSKLSNYNLHDRKYGDKYDRDITNDKSTARVYSFQVFLSYYFDISLSPVVHPFALDRWFMKYGQLLTDTIFAWIFLDELNIVVWQLFVFQAIRLCLSDFSIGKSVICFTPVIAIKLLKLNYLRSYEKTYDFRMIITLESVAQTLLILCFTFINK